MLNRTIVDGASAGHIANLQIDTANHVFPMASHKQMDFSTKAVAGFP